MNRNKKINRVELQRCCHCIHLFSTVLAICKISTSELEYESFITVPIDNFIDLVYYKNSEMMCNELNKIKAIIDMTFDMMNIEGRNFTCFPSFVSDFICDVMVSCRYCLWCL